MPLFGPRANGSASARRVFQNHGFPGVARRSRYIDKPKPFPQDNNVSPGKLVRTMRTFAFANHFLESRGLGTLLSGMMRTGIFFNFSPIGTTRSLTFSFATLGTDLMMTHVER